MREFNASFERLERNRICWKRKWGSTRCSVQFKYERFFEYFAGRRLFQVAANAPSKVEFYLDVAGKLSKSIFLWGALIQAFYAELVEENIDLFINLASKTGENPLLRSTMVKSIAWCGDIDASNAEDCVLKLFGEMIP